MSLEDFENEKSDNVQIKDLPTELDVEIAGIAKTTDKQKRKCTNIEYTLLNGALKDRNITVKYTPYHYPALIESMKKLGIMEFTIGMRLHLKQQTFGMGYPRHIPTEILE